MTAHDIFKKLRAIFPSPAHVLLPQVRNGTGFQRAQVRTADALAFSLFPSRGLWIAGIEIKRLLSDWKKELADADKADAIHRYCHYWYIAAPTGLIPQAELPETWGLIETDGKKTKIEVKATRQEPKPLDMLMICAIMRAITESTTPNEDVADKVESQVEARKGQDKYDLTNLRETVATFEKESGIKMSDRWAHGDIGKAVKMLVNSGLLYRDAQIDQLRVQAQHVLDSCDALKKAMGTM